MAGRIEINKKAPDFVLADFEGMEVKLSDFVNFKNVILVLNRGFT